MSEPMNAKGRAAVVDRVSNYLDAFLTDPWAFRGQQLRGGGAVAEFEALLAARCGFSYCVATCNATTALIGLAVILRVQGRAVWFPESHWEGSVSAMRLMGAKIRRYDPSQEHAISLDDGGLDPIVVTSKGVGFAGAIRRNGTTECLIIEDSSRIPGFTAESDSRSDADIQVLSFGPGKPLSLCEGGAALFRKQEHRERFLAVTQHPERIAAEQGHLSEVPSFAINGRIHPVSALVGIEFLRQGEPVVSPYS